MGALEARGCFVFSAQLYEQAMRRYLVAGAYRDEAMWRYELSGRSENSDSRAAIRVVETGEEPVGYLAHRTRLWHSVLAAFAYELKPGVSWLAVTPSVVRYLIATGEHTLGQDAKDRCEGLAFELGSEHPAYHVMHEGLPHRRRPYAWYLRVADVPAFLRRVAPVLEQRLAESVAVGHTGDLKLSFYRSGVRLVFDGGRLTAVEPWAPTHEDSGDAAFPNLTFLQMLFGYWTILELRDMFPDCWVKSDAAGALLWALFPRRISRVWPIM